MNNVRSYVANKSQVNTDALGTFLEANTHPMSSTKVCKVPSKKTIIYMVTHRDGRVIYIGKTRSTLKDRKHRHEQQCFHRRPWYEFWSKCEHRNDLHFEQVDEFTETRPNSLFGRKCEQRCIDRYNPMYQGRNEIRKGKKRRNTLKLSFLNEQGNLEVTVVNGRGGLSVETNK